jgi:hypothetical protein
VVEWRTWTQKNFLCPFFLFVLLDLYEKKKKYKSKPVLGLTQAALLLLLVADGVASGEPLLRSCVPLTVSQELDRMRREAEMLISTVAKTGRAPPPPETAAASPPPAASAAKPAPEPILGAPQHSTKNRKLTAEEQLFALAGEGERPPASSEGLFAKVAQMAQAAEEAAPAPVQVVDRPAPAPVTHHKRVDTPILAGPAKQSPKAEKKAKDEAQRPPNKGKKAAKASLARVDTPLPSTLSNAAAGALGTFTPSRQCACTRIELVILPSLQLLIMRRQARIPHRVRRSACCVPSTSTFAPTRTRARPHHP